MATPLLPNGEPAPVAPPPASTPFPPVPLGAEDSGKGAAVVVQRRVITWTPEGLPVPTSQPLLSKRGIEELASVALSLPYVVPQPELPPEPAPEAPLTVTEKYERERDAILDKYHAEVEKFAGMTNAEVMMVRQAEKAANGDSGAANDILDRVLGKPKQSVESKNLNLTYEDMLKEKAARASEVVDAEVVRSDDLWGGLK
jgi:hypothetical protein